MDDFALTGRLQLTDHSSFLESAAEHSKLTSAYRCVRTGQLSRNRSTDGPEMSFRFVLSLYRRNNCLLDFQRATSSALLLTTTSLSVQVGRMRCAF